MSTAEPSPPAPVTVVTGANSGIGRATAVHLAGVGHRVIGTVRAVERATKLRAFADDAGVTVELVELDVADDRSVADGFEEVFDRAGRVDHLINNAGVAGNAVVEECPSSLYLDVMNVNLCGVTRCTQAVLPQMRERGSGTIVNVTSVAGRIAALAQSPYVASKWALEGVSDALAQELAPFGIRVAIIEPGVTKSAIFAKNIDAPNSSGAYDAHYRRMFQFFAAGLANATDPFEVARVIEHAITTDEPRLRYPVSWGAEQMAALHDRIDDATWLELGAIEDDETYIARFRDVSGSTSRPDRAWSARERASAGDDREIEERRHAGWPVEEVRDRVDRVRAGRCEDVAVPTMRELDVHRRVTIDRDRPVTGGPLRCGQFVHPPHRLLGDDRSSPSHRRPPVSLAGDRAGADDARRRVQVVIRDPQFEVRRRARARDAEAGGDHLHRFGEEAVDPPPVPHGAGGELLGRRPKFIISNMISGEG